MKVGIMQPYFMPYIGYFQLMKAVDKYVVYDDVNYIKGGWVSRNNILMNGEKKMFTIRLQGASPNKLFNQIEVADDFRKFMKTLQTYYAKAPYFVPASGLIERIISYPEKKLSLFIMSSFQEILDYLNIKTELILSSVLPKDCSLKGKDKVIQICKLLKSDNYINAIGGQELYDKKDFEQQSINLFFLEPELKPYPQLSADFVPYLSFIDVLMNNSPESINSLLDCYKLI